MNERNTPSRNIEKIQGCFDQMASEAPSFEEHLNQLKEQNRGLTLENFQEIVRLPADGVMIRKLIRKFILTEPEDMGFGSLETKMSDGVYNALQKDLTNVEEFNVQDQRALENMVSADMLQRGLNPLESGYNQQPGWHTFKSWRLLGTPRISSKAQSQRLYISTPGDNVHKTASMIYETLRDSGLPFYFKVQDESSCKSGRQDSIVLYTSADLLMPTIDALSQAGAKHPEITNKCREPGPTLGKVNEWIGYASEIDSSTEESYNGLIAKCLFAGMGRSIEKWCKTHPGYKRGSQTVEVYFREAKQKVFHGEIAHPQEQKELMRRMQYLLSAIPKVDPNFSSSVCEETRTAMESVGLDVNNVCVTPFSRQELARARQAVKH